MIYPGLTSIFEGAYTSPPINQSFV